MFCASPYFTVFFHLQRLLIIDYGKNQPYTIILTHVSEFGTVVPAVLSILLNLLAWIATMLSSIGWISSPNIANPSALPGTLLKWHEGLILQQCYRRTAQIGLSGGLSEEKPVGSGSSTNFQASSRWSWDWQRRLRISLIFRYNGGN